MSQSNRDPTERMAQIGLRLPSELKTEVAQIAHDETEPGVRDVKQSHVIRAAIRFYLDHYEDQDAPEAFELGGR